MSIKQTFDINMIPDSSPVILHCDQYDEGTGRYEATLYEGSVSYIPGAGATAIVQGMKPDKHGFMYSATINTDKVTFDLTEQMSACAGMVACQLVVTESTGRTGTFVFFLNVQQSALPQDSDLSQTDLQLIEQLLEEAEALNLYFPYIGANGNWWYYSVADHGYVDSGVDASITITIGTTTTLPAGSSATVTNSGTATDPIFNFGIPKGDKGDKGDTGAKGDPGVASVTYDAANKAIIFTPV
jgi:hypothetical protein